MTLRRMILILSLIGISCSALGVKGTNGSDMSPDHEDNSSQTISCTIHTKHLDWRGRKEETVSVEFRFQGTSQITVLPSLHIRALPKRQELIPEEYWAPFDVTTGLSAKARQVVQQTDEARLRSVRLIPSRLLWASTKSSVWPSQNLAKTVPPGRYMLRAQLELEGGKTISSNEVEITLMK